MSKKSRAYKQARKCHLCGRNGQAEPLERYHVFGGAYRMKSERYGAVVDLCRHSCHREGKGSVHKNRLVSDSLKEEFQMKIMAEQGWTVEQFIEEFGKNYT